MKINRETFHIEFYDKDGSFINSIHIGSTTIKNSLFIEMVKNLENELIDYKNFCPDEYKSLINSLVENPVLFFFNWDHIKIIEPNLLRLTINKAIENLILKEKYLNNWKVRRLLSYPKSKFNSRCNQR